MFIYNFERFNNSILILQAHLWHKHQGSKFSVTLNSGDQSACSFRAIFLQEIEQVSINSIFPRKRKLAQGTMSRLQFSCSKVIAQRVLRNKIASVSRALVFDPNEGIIVLGVGLDSGPLGLGSLAACGRNGPQVK